MPECEKVSLLYFEEFDNKTLLGASLTKIWVYDTRFLISVVDLMLGLLILRMAILNWLDICFHFDLSILYNENNHVQS